MAKAPLELLRNDYLVVTLEEDGLVVRHRRLAQPYPDLQALRAALGAVHALYEGFGPGRRGLLVDMRDAPGRNDPEFESVLADFRLRGLQGFVGQAVLMSTAVGRLQAQRHMRGDGVERLVTDNEEDALKYLRQRVALPLGHLGGKS